MKNNNIPTLSIKDLVLLKQHPQEYYKRYIRKTHDGTSTGPVRGHLKDFVNKRTKSSIKYYKLIGSDGKEIGEVKLVPGYGVKEDNPYSYDNSNGKYDLNEVYDKIGETGETGMHVITNEGYLIPYRHAGIYSLMDKDFMVLPNEKEIDQLMLKNDDGEYLVQSVTVVGENGKSITLAKYNEFTDIDGASAKSIINSMNADIQSKNEEAKKVRDVLNRNVDHSMDNLNQFVEERENTEKAVGEVYGTNSFEDYLLDTYSEDLANANVKLKIQKNENVDKEYDWKEDNKDFHGEFEKQRGHPWKNEDWDDSDEDMFMDEDGNLWESEEEYIDAMADRADRAYDEWRDRGWG